MVHPAASLAALRMRAALATPDEALFRALEDVDFEGGLRALAAGASPDARCRQHSQPGHDDPGGFPTNSLGFLRETPKERLAKVEYERGPLGDTALIQACASFRCVPMLHKLLAAGADPNLGNGHGVTPLMALCGISRGWMPAEWALGELLGAGARLDDQDAWGCTALIHAAQAGAGNVVLALLGAGADPRLATEAGAQAIDFVMWGGYEDDYREVESGVLAEALGARSCLLYERDAIASASASAPRARPPRI